MAMKRDLTALCFTMALAAGCSKPAPIPASFEPNHVFSLRLEMQNGMDTNALDQPLADCQVLLAEWFGTPGDPKLPEMLQAGGEFAGLVSMDNLKMAAGPAPAGTEPKDVGLFAQQCVTCHGETGSGRGTTAASQNPYPRDFRFGEFKFKSTPRTSKPTRDDLKRTLVQGLAGTQMPILNDATKWNDARINSLVDYVIYLSIRGQLERELLQQAAIDSLERLYDPSSSEFDEQKEFAESKLTMITSKWLKAASEVENFEPPPGMDVNGTPTAGSESAFQDSLLKGKELFLGQVATCSKCHGEDGKGGGKQAPDFDDFTKDWTTKAELDPTDLTALQPMMAMGAMKPQPLPPRDLTEGKFRGGGRPIDIFRRIRYGIDMTPMPAAALQAEQGEKGLSDVDIWHLVNYVLSLSRPTQTL